jgi:cytochrome c peroxidase
VSKSAWYGCVGAAILAIGVVACGGSSSRETPPPGPAWERENPIKPPAAPLGMEVFFEDVKPPSPASVRLGRWLFYDTRLSADHSIACASCHKPEYAFSEPTPVSTGIRGQKGGRKAPTIINKAVTLAPHFFWDGRARSLEDQVLGPIANPIEMGNTHEAMIDTLSRVQGYKPYFKEAFGHRGDHQGARRAGDRRLRAHTGQRQLTLRPLALQSRAERGVCRG